MHWRRRSSAPRRWRRLPEGCRRLATWALSSNGYADAEGGPHQMTADPLLIIIVYSAVIIGLGVWSARFVKTSSAFFVAGRSLGPGLIFASMLAANIGAGSTVGAAGLAYRDGLSAWWWVGSAGLGSIVFAFFVAPRLWQVAKDHDFYTTGDYLEFRSGPAV